MKRLSCLIFLLVLPLFELNAQTVVEFVVSEIPSTDFDKVGIRGNSFPLSWQKSLELKKSGEAYSISLDFSEDTKEIEFKFVLFNEDEEIEWEGIENRVLRIDETQKLISKNEWNTEQQIDLSEIKLLSKEELLADYKLLEAMIMKVHPGTFRYNDSSSIQKAFDELERKFQSSLSVGETYLALSKLTAGLKCDHTQVGFNNQDKIVNSIIHRQADKLPFSFQWIDEKMFVDYNASESNELIRGTEVFTINGVSVKKILNALLPYVAADGSTDKSRVNKLEVEAFDFRYNAFDVFYPLVFPIDDGNLNLIILDENKNLKTTSVKAITRKDRCEKLYERYPDFPKSKDDLWGLEILENKTAILSINSFGLMGWKKMTIDYKAFLSNAFKTIKEKNIEHLILDTRISTGGNDEIVDELLTYFDCRNQTENKTDFQGRTRYLKFPEELKPYIKTWGDEPWFYNLEPDEIDKKTGYYIFNEAFASNKEFKIKKDYFQGNTYLLTSPANASLSFYLAKNFRDYKIGEIIGEETGGNLQGINGGQILFFKLPNSGIEIDIPVMGSFALGDVSDSGVIPDIEVSNNMKSLKNGVDLQLVEVLQTIKRAEK